MKKTLAGIAATLTLGFGVTACADGGSSDQAADGKEIKVVASTSVWGHCRGSSQRARQCKGRDHFGQ